MAQIEGEAHDLQPGLQIEGQPDEQPDEQVPQAPAPPSSPEPKDDLEEDPVDARAQPQSFFGHRLLDYAVLIIPVILLVVISLLCMFFHGPRDQYMLTETFLCSLAWLTLFLINALGMMFNYMVHGEVRYIAVM